MELQTVQTRGVTVVVLTGDLDLSAAEHIKHGLTGLILADCIEKGHSKVVVDLGAVPFIDSSGLAVLVAAMKQARATGGDLRLCALQDDVWSVLEMTGLTNHIAVHGDRHEALSSWE